MAFKQFALDLSCDPLLPLARASAGFGCSLHKLLVAEALNQSLQLLVAEALNQVAAD